MQPIAAWLVERQRNAVVGLAATLLIPILQLFSGMILVLLVLSRGERFAVIAAAIAGVIVTAIVALSGAPPVQVPLEMLLLWVPALLLAMLLRSTQSLTLTLQVSALLLALGAVAVFGVASDPVSLAEPLTAYWLEWMRASGLNEQAGILAANPARLARDALFVLLWTVWVIYVVFLLFGYRFYRQITPGFGKFGRFSELDFGRVIAATMAVVSVIAFLSGMIWLQNIAFVLLSVFWLQGLAIAHWLYEYKLVPLLVVIVIYVMLPILSILLIIALAVIGYSDAWFRYRRRVPTSK